MNHVKKTKSNASKQFQQMEEVSKLYFVALKHVNNHSVLHDSEETYDEYKEYLAKVREAWFQLDDLEKTIINNEYFYQDYPYWWEKIYSRSSFYRLKRISVAKFLEAFGYEA